ncbi:hypothetical protein NM688_g4845 [Phlebia brevispora]|uniref:Uncharacterized protein n=1 Tax=Phlebia brevispora TaxID=194682 RepID=A0ACC1T1T8_9APHY|nr:hypothetical protein NM688_g4845 [Phlebia brevispora]
MSEGGSIPVQYPQIFAKDDGSPVRFLLMDVQDDLLISWDQTPLSPAHIKTLSRQIQRHGGELLEQDRRDEVDTLIVNEEAVEDYKRFYKLHRTIYAEPPGFVSRCIRAGKYHHQPPQQRGMGGRLTGAKRTPFTKDDERFMCEFIALTIPDPSSGGRLGPGIWKWLIDEYSQQAEYAWANRHTVQSWQEHYKKNRERLDARVAKIVKANPPPADGKTLYHLSRHKTYRNIRFEQMEEVVEEEIVEELVTPRKRKRVDRDESRPLSEETQDSRLSSIARRLEEEESSHDEGEVEWPEDLFEPEQPVEPEDTQPDPKQSSATPSTQGSRAAPLPRVVHDDTDANFLMSSQATLVAPSQPRQAAFRPPERSSRRREVIVETPSPEEVLRTSGSRAAAQRPRSAEQKKRTLPAPRTPQPAAPSRRNFATSGRLNITPVTGNHDESLEDEVQIIEEIVIEDDDEAEPEDEHGSHSSAEEPDDVEITGTAPGHGHDRLYPDFEEVELLSSDDERLVENLSRNRISPPKKRLGSNRGVPGVFPHSPPNEEEHHDFSASEPEGEEQDTSIPSNTSGRSFLRTETPAASTSRRQVARSAPTSAKHIRTPARVLALASQVRSEGRQVDQPRSTSSSPLPSPPVTRTYLTRKPARTGRA